MSEQNIIKAQPRSERGKEQARKLRGAGMIPGVLYGGGKDSVSIMIEHDEITPHLKHNESNVIFKMKIKGAKEEEPVMIQDYQVDPVTHSLHHIDFIRVVYGHAIHVTIPIELTGTAPGVKMGGFLDFVNREVNVECLPSKIPPKISVDVSGLGIMDHYDVSHLELGEDIKILDDLHNIIVRVSPPKVTVEEAVGEAAEVAEGAEPEVISKGKKEEEEIES